MANIAGFKNALRDGGTRANQFNVYISADGTDQSFLCNATSLPGSNVGITSAFYRGRELKLAGERTFDNWTVTVVNETDFAIHTYLMGWSNDINNLADNSGMTKLATYAPTDLYVDQLDRNDNILRTFTFYDAWPVSVGDIPLSFNANDQIEEFQVTFAYTSWAITGGGLGGAGGTIGVPV